MAQRSRINDRYRVIRPLGEGAQAAVFLVEDERAEGARRALKVVTGLDADNQARRARLAGEFSRLANLSHPRLVGVYDLGVTTTASAGIDAGTVFFTADYVEGRSPHAVVDDAVTRAHAPDGHERDLVRLILAIAEDIASALAHIHAAGLVHCDVKPDNILIARDADASRPVAMLFDLGLSTARGISGRARGTLAYMAPEALSGRIDPRSDLYALGATLYHLVTGRMLFETVDATALIRAICTQPTPIVSCAWLPVDVRALIERMLAREVAERPSGAHVVLDDIERIREALGVNQRSENDGSVRRTTLTPPPTLLPPRLIGRTSMVAAIANAIDAIHAGRSSGLVRLIGVPGSGRKAVISEVVRDRQLAAAAGLTEPISFVRGNLERVASSLGVRLDTVVMETTTATIHDLDQDIPSEDAPGLRLLAWVDKLLERAIQLAPVVLILEDNAGDDARIDALTRVLLAAGEVVQGRGLLVIACYPQKPDGIGSGMDIEIPPLSPGDTHDVVQSMVGRAVDLKWTQTLARASGGLPRLIVESVRTACARAGIDRMEQVAIDTLMNTADSFASLVVARVSLLSPTMAGVLEALAVLSGHAAPHVLAAVIERKPSDVHTDLARLQHLGLVVIDDLDEGALSVRLPSSAHTKVLHEAIPPTRRKALHRAAFAVIESTERDPIRGARHLLETGPNARAVQMCMSAGRALWQRGDIVGALDMLRRASERVSGAAVAEVHIALAHVATVAGHYDEAERAATRAYRTKKHERRRRAGLALARVRHKRGDLDGAERVLRTLIAHERDEASQAAGTHVARGMVARILIARGRYEDAERAAGEPDIGPDATSHVRLSPGLALRLESAGLARLYRGDIDGAEHAFERLEQLARSQLERESDDDGVGVDGASGRATLGRALSLRGMVAHSRGNIAEAAVLYRDAGTHASAAGDVHAAAVYDINQATAHSERGRFGDALRALSSARDALARLGNVTQLAAALFNRGIALLSLGQIAAARRAAEEALRTARTPRMLAYAHLLVGDTCRREGDLGRATTAYARALEHASASGCERETFLALLESAVTLAENNDTRAFAFLARADDAVHSSGDRDHLTVARARIALSIGCTMGESPEHPGPPAPTLVRAIADLAARAAASGRLDQAWRTSIIAARLYRAQDDDTLAKRYCRDAHERWQAILSDIPEAHRDGMRSDPDARSLTTLTTELGLQRGAGSTLTSDEWEARHTKARLRRLLSLSRRLNAQLSSQRLLDDVIDTAIEMTAAERGFLLLREHGELEIVVARHFDHESLDGDDARLSRSMAERAARTGEVVLTVDAAYDDRFGMAESVAALRLRSVLAVPLRQKGTVIGTIYVDHRFRRSAFADDAIELVQELADIAAVAIENARLIEQSRQRQREIVALNRRLEAEVADKETELQRMRLRVDKDAGLRHAYPAIIGRSPLMLAMLRIIDRAADTALPVVIFGESGTGKELVARALHDSGSRRNGPFVPVNCGAVSSELLESELFGHVRGSFTGAERDRRGLFEVADGGTLFLDEIADTSTAMQTKLLRVLQEGEIRRVGENRARKIDVRVVAASNKPLEALVKQGRFREDLYYRLNVLHIDVPCLRERPQDIPELVEHLLGRLARDREVPHVTDAALSRLMSHTWPGNVRELENHLARAMAMSGDIIDVADLSPRLASVVARSDLDDGDDLQLKPRVEALERRLVDEAMRRTGGNQTAAAKLLGMSRFGLQKKLKRYGISGSR